MLEIILDGVEGKVTLREQIIQKIYDETLVHFSSKQSYTYARKYFTWKDMEKDFKEYTRTCDFCQ